MKNVWAAIYCLNFLTSTCIRSRGEKISISTDNHVQATTKKNLSSRLTDVDEPDTSSHQRNPTWLADHIRTLHFWLSNPHVRANACRVRRASAEMQSALKAEFLLKNWRRPPGMQQPGPATKGNRVRQLHIR